MPNTRRQTGGHRLTQELHEQFRQIDEARREKDRPAQEERERRSRCEEAVTAFANALRPVREDAETARFQGRTFDPSPHIPDIAGRLGEAIEAVRTTGRIALLEDLNLDEVCQQAVRGGSASKEKVRPALDFAAQLLRETPVDGESLESLVRELWFNPALHSSGTTLHLLLRILSGMNRFPKKPTVTEIEGSGDASAQSSPNDELFPAPPPARNEYFGPADLAARYNVPQPALEARLRRWRRNHLADSGRGWMEATDRGPRQPLHLYRVQTVLHIVEELRASGERRAKK